MSKSKPTLLRTSLRWGTRALTSGALAVGVLATAPMTTDAHAATAHHRHVEHKVGHATRVAVRQNQSSETGKNLNTYRSTASNHHHQ